MLNAMISILLLSLSIFIAQCNGNHNVEVNVEVPNDNLPVQTDPPYIVRDEFTESVLTDPDYELSVVNSSNSTAVKNVLNNLMYKALLQATERREVVFSKQLVSTLDMIAVAKIFLGQNATDDSIRTKRKEITKSLFDASSQRDNFFATGKGSQDFTFYSVMYSTKSIEFSSMHFEITDAMVENSIIYFGGHSPSDKIFIKNASNGIRECSFADQADTDVILNCNNPVELIKVGDVTTIAGKSIYWFGKGSCGGTVVTCPPAVPFSEGYNIDNTTNYHYGTTVSYTCASGYAGSPGYTGGDVQCLHTGGVGGWTSPNGCYPVSPIECAPWKFYYYDGNAYKCTGPTCHQFNDSSKKWTVLDSSPIGSAHVAPQTYPHNASNGQIGEFATTNHGVEYKLGTSSKFWPWCCDCNL